MVRNVRKRPIFVIVSGRVRNGKIARSVPRAAKTGPPRDPLRNHPAVLLVKNITGKWPPRTVFDRLARELGETPDAARFAEIYEEWRARGYRPTNLAGMLDWYRKGIPPIRGERPPGGMPAAKPLEERPRSESELADLRTRLRALRDAAKRSAE